jgi:predicted DCC family thiol-disulfide oxidoreductase YuxK
MDRPTTEQASTRLTILYDERCAFCLRCVDWLATQPCLVGVDLLAAGSSTARERYGSVPWLGRELVVADDRGRVWMGPAAFLVCLWATARYRPWAYRLARRGWSGIAERFFIHVSKSRDRWSRRRGERRADCSWCDDMRMRGAT